MAPGSNRHGDGRSSSRAVARGAEERDLVALVERGLRCSKRCTARTCSLGEHRRLECGAHVRNLTAGNLTGSRRGDQSARASGGRRGLGHDCGRRGCTRVRSARYVARLLSQAALP
ncbi:skin secretory protein xP2 [Iris pallida]|uniref:Skin secretory protein xP2 n=1 Tax=Iris pallida TaxID=29817 RepID=A0AAX6I874_IRIPA|nr:skin secretory protein xP2 [Iris pallida]